VKQRPAARRGHGDEPKSLAAVSDATSRTLTLAAALAAVCALLLFAFTIAFPAKRSGDSASLARINAAVAAVLRAPADRGFAETKSLVRAALGADAYGPLARSLETAADGEALLEALRGAAVERRAGAERDARALIFAAALIGLVSAAATAGIAVFLRRLNRHQGAFFDRLDELIDRVEDSIRGGRGEIEWRGDAWIETRDLARRAARLAGELAFSRELVDATHGAQDLDELLEELPRALGRVLPAERVAIAFLDRAGNVVAERAVSAGAAIRLDVGFSQPLADSDLARVAGSARARVIGDLAALPTVSRATGLILQEGFRSSLTAPLLFGDRCVGFLFINARAPFAYGPEEAELAERIAASLRAPVYHHYVVQLLLAETARGFVRSMEKRDNETSLHIERMSLYAHAVARELARVSGDDPDRARELRPRALRELLWFAPLHDIGKIGIPDAILFKPGPLDPPERAVMETHVEMGASIFRDINEGLSRYLPSPPLDTAVDLILGHHERWDGSGYPRGLAGARIPLAARITSAADVLDALTSARPYKEAWSLDAAMDYIAARAGSQFDPAVVAALLAIRPEIERIRAAHADAPGSVGGAD